MYLDHRVIAKIARTLEQIDMSALLLDASGNVILPEGDRRQFTLPEELRSAPTTPLIYGGVTLIGTEEEQPLYICLHGDSNEVKNCAILCAELINMMLRADAGQTSREQALRLILRGEAEGAELESLALEHEIPFEQSRCVLYFYFSEGEAETILPQLQAVLGDDDGADMYAEVARHSIAMLKTVDASLDFEALDALARELEEAYPRISEQMTIYIGISEPRTNLTQLSEAYEEARDAINVGHVYHPSGHVFIYRRLILERFLNDVPADVRQRYNAMIFNRKTARLFNDEMIRTIETFFENSLNLSETARRLYIHRNTLVYRLEKVQRAIGLDLRSFDDAITFKLMMLLGKNGIVKKQRL